MKKRSVYDGLWTGDTLPFRRMAEVQGAAFLRAAESEGFVGLDLVVAENMGWHFDIYGPSLMFYPRSSGCIAVLAGEYRAGRPGWSDSLTYTSFTEAWRDVLRRADDEIRRLQRLRELIDRHRP